MPNITAAGTYTKDTSGFSFLTSSGGSSRTLLIDGDSSVDIKLKYTDDAGTDRTLENGTITSLPKSIEIGVLAKDLKIVVGGSPTLINVTGGGIQNVRA
jgi:hypothetical protein